MILRSVEVCGVGRFRTRMRLEGLGPRVNVLAAPNEAGKSTLFRAVRTALFQRHDSRAQDIKDLATNDATLPIEIRVGFAKGNHDYAIAKNFLRSPSASLLRDGREIARGKHADEALWEILGVAPGSGRAIDEAAFGLLWVGQTRSFELDRLSDAAAGAVNQAIASEIGELVGGERARAVLAGVRASLATLETDKGKPKTGGPLKTAQDRLAEIEAEEAVLDEKLLQLEGAFRDLASARADLGRLNDPTLRGGLERQLSEAREALTAAEAAAGVLARLDLAREAAEGRRTTLETQLATLEEAAERIASTRAALAALTTQLTARDRDAAEAQSRLAEARKAVEAVDEALVALARKTEGLRRLDEAAQAAERLQEVETRLERAAAARTRIQELDRTLATLRIAPAHGQELDRLERQLHLLEARQEAASPRLAIALEPGAVGRIALDGTALGGDETRLVIDPVTIRIAGIGTLTVTPPLGGAAAARELSEARRALAAHLAHLGVASGAEARASLARREALAREREGLLAQLAGLAPAGSGGPDWIARLESQAAALTGQIGAALAEAGLSALPGSADIAARREALLGRERDLKVERARLAAAQDAAARDAERLIRDASGLRGQRQGLEGALTDALRRAPDESRAAELDRLREALRAARAAEAAAAVDAARQRATAPAPGAMQALALKVERLVQSLENHDELRSDLQQRVAGLEGAIMAAEGDGLGERLAALREARDLAAREAARLGEEAASLRLLRDTIEECLAEGRERYVAPVKQQLKPFLEDLFPEADLDLADGFAPVSLRRERGEERFDLLSHGTREQLAVLVRLAFGGLLASRGEAVPVILDDALVFSDDERIDLMFNALSRAALSQQVIVLTCRARTFAPLGGTMLRLEPV